MPFADYLGEPGCLDSCDEYKAYEAELRAKEEAAYLRVQSTAMQSPLATEKAQRESQAELADIWDDRQDLEPLVGSCSKSACAVVAFCASKAVTTS